MALNREKSTVKKEWNFGADSWNDFVGNKKDYGKTIIAPGILRMLPKGTVKNARALDVCCGEGHYARLLQKRGYKVTGVDISDKMIGLAKKKSMGIEYHCSDAAKMSYLKDGMFDLVVCSMGLIDTPDLNGTLDEIQRVLKKGGQLIISITHPCFDRPRMGAWERDADGRKLHFKIDNYSKECRIVVDWNMKRMKYPFVTRSYHRTLSTYINALAKNNLIIDKALEPYTKADGTIDDEEFRVPNFFIIRCVKS